MYESPLLSMLSQATESIKHGRAIRTEITG